MTLKMVRLSGPTFQCRWSPAPPDLAVPDGEIDTAQDFGRAVTRREARGSPGGHSGMNAPRGYQATAAPVPR